MPQMNFDLEDGHDPVSFVLKSQDADRFIAFMEDCTEALRRESDLLATSRAHDELVEAVEALLAANDPDTVTAQVVPPAFCDKLKGLKEVFERLS